jgi:hypothetical protein
MFPYCEDFVEGDPASLPDLLLCEDGDTDSGSEDDSGGGESDTDDGGTGDDDAEDGDDPGMSPQGSGCSTNRDSGILALSLLLVAGVLRRVRRSPNQRSSVAPR